MITGKHLIDAGFKSGPWFSEAIKAANEAGDNWLEVVRLMEPVDVRISLDSYDKQLDINLIPDDEIEQENFDNVLSSMKEIMKTPGVVEGAIMPDACPAGPLGTIPVGGIVSSKNIHPGMHSADICCSVFITVFDDNASPIDVLNSVHSITHFGFGGRKDATEMPQSLKKQLKENPFTREFLDVAQSNFMTQGDGNHFAFVGKLESTGQTALVTHHGSRGIGAALYKRGMAVAEKTRLKCCPEVLKQNAWIDATTQNGIDYWDALQIIKFWTYHNHLAIHEAASRGFGVVDSFWNEHNFVFQKPEDGLFYHAKGATPAFGKYMEERTLIPLNMSEPVLIVQGLNKGLGFSPHGAGRNMSRTKHKAMMIGRTDEEIFAEETKGLDVRFFSGKTDISELPSAYKSAKKVQEQIEHFGLATVVDRVLPFGCIMAGEQEQFWRKK